MQEDLKSGQTNAFTSRGLLFLDVSEVININIWALEFDFSTIAANVIIERKPYLGRT